MIVKYFGIISEITGKSKEDISFSGEFAELINFLKRKYKISAYLKDYSLLLNGEYVEKGRKMKHTDVLVFLPIAMGG